MLRILVPGICGRHPFNILGRYSLWNGKIPPVPPDVRVSKQGVVETYKQAASLNILTHPGLLAPSLPNRYT